MKPGRLFIDSGATLWLASGALVTALHAVALIALSSAPPVIGSDPSAAVVIEFAEMRVASAAPLDLPPGPEQVESKAVPQPKDEPREETAKLEEELPTVPNPEIAFNKTPKPPEENTEKPSLPPAEMTSAPQAFAEKVATVAAAPQQGAPTREASNDLPLWTGKISMQLERAKRYPSSSRAKGNKGVVHVTFSIARDGRLLKGEVVQSSGYSALDEEALALLNRAQPFPPVPREIAGEAIRLTVPIRFEIK